MSSRYTKADLEQIVSVQLENLNAMHDLHSIMKCSLPDFSDSKQFKKTLITLVYISVVLLLL